MSAGTRAALLRRPHSSWLACLALGMLAAAPPARAQAQDESTRDAPISEGALDNDVFVPQADSAAAALTSGDQALQQARAATTAAEAARQLDVAFDQWRNALVQGGPGAATWRAPPANGEQRLAEGVRAGVERRLLALEAEERARWSARHAPAAELSLAELREGHSTAQRAAALAEFVRLFPLTPASARAALALGDLALEAGLAARARGWYGRARIEAAHGDPALLPALEARTARLVAPAADPRSEHLAEPWQRAKACDFADSFSWSDPGRRGARERDQSSPRPGGTFVGADTFAVQTARELFLLLLAESGKLELVERRSFSDLLGGFSPEAFEAPSALPSWPLLPFADEQQLVLVAGRLDAGEPNALVVVDLDLSAEAQLGLDLELGVETPAAALAWAVVGSERLDARGAATISELLELGPFEFQPGPVTCGDWVVAQARQFDGQVRSHLLAFDRRDGTLAWRRQLAAGADRVVTPRFTPTLKRVAGQPLLALWIEGQPRVFAGTHLGLGVLFDPLLGEPLWSLKNRRRDERKPSWNGDRPLLGTGPDEAPVVLWAPMDSDRLYCLVPAPLAGPSAEALDVLACPPAPVAEAESLLGGGTSEHVVLGRSGAGRTVSARRAGTDRIEALQLGADERFAGLGALSPERAWVSSDRELYLLDRTRELYLLDREPLPPAGAEPLGGDVLARGPHVLVLGSGALWSFRAR